MGRRSCGFEADGFNELVEIVDGARVEAVELRSVLAVEPGVALDGREEPGSRLGVDAFEELQEDETDRVAVEEEPVAARVHPARGSWVVPAKLGNSQDIIAVFERFDSIAAARPRRDDSSSPCPSSTVRFAK